MSIKRKLPSHSNPLLAENIPSFDELVDMRRLGQTKLYNSKAGADKPALLFSYVHLRAPLPTSINPEIFGSGSGSKPEAYFLMRRSKDGFVSATGMFKASFPMASKAEEELERRYVKANYHTSQEETAGNLWIHPEDAVSLSSDYNCRVWIEALVDNKSVLSDSRSRAVTPPPPYKAANDTPPTESPVQNATAALRSSSRSTRSASPIKKRKSGRPSKHHKELSSLKREANVEKSEPAEEEVDKKPTKKEDETAEGEDTNEEQAEAAAPATSFASEDHAFTVEVEKTTETNGDIKVESTHVKVEVAASEHPVSLESPEEMIAKAKEMVAEAMKAEENAAEPTKSSKKRKVEDMDSNPTEEGEVAEEAGAVATPDDESLRAKRPKLLEGALTQKFRKRAIIGLGATLAIGVTSVAIPYLL